MSGTEPHWEDVKRLCIEDRSNTLIFIVTPGTNLCAQLLGLLRDQDMLELNAAARFESGWAMYLKQYAAGGGAFGALLCPQMKKLGPIVAMGGPYLLADLTRALILRARELSRGSLTPLFFERAFETIVKAVSAELQTSGGAA